jgi:hypothetical protein
MHPKAERLMPDVVLTTVGPLLQRVLAPDRDAPRCPWCYGPAVWTTGNKTRCTVCGFVPS